MIDLLAGVMFGVFLSLSVVLILLTIRIWSLTRKLEEWEEPAAHDPDCLVRLGMRCNCYVGSE